MSGYGISFNVLSEAQDNSRLESDAAQSTTIHKTLSCDSNAANLPHLDTTVRHLLIHHVVDLETQLPDQVVVQEGGVGCGDDGGLQHGEGSPLNNKDVFTDASTIIVGKGCVGLG